MKKSLWVTVALLGLGAASAGHAQALRSVTPARGSSTSGASSTDDRWRESLEAFAAADKLHAPNAGGVLFVGSSSIRLWNDLETEFENAPVIKRGFGGSRMSDCTRYVEQLVLAYRPRVVIVYAGDNDLAEGASPNDVLQSFTQFVGRVRDALPDTRVAYLSIKPSPLRAALMPKVIETNGLIEAYTATQPHHLEYIDIYSKMLGADGNPRAELYQADSLHLNADGYAIWKRAISEHLGSLMQTSVARLSP